MASQPGDGASNTASASGSATPQNQTNPRAARSTFGGNPNLSNNGGLFGASTPPTPFVASSSPFGAAPQNQTAGLFGRTNPQTPTNPQTTISPFRFLPLPSHPNFQGQTVPQTTVTGSMKPSPSPSQAQTTPQTATISDDDAAAMFCFPDGDLNIFVTYQGITVVGKVSSAAMCLASRVFKKFIFPPFGPSLVKGADDGETGDTSGGENPGDETSGLDLQEDDGEALLLLLRIAHLQFHKIPEKLPFRQLLNLSILLDLYDNIELVIPWVPRWFSNEDTESNTMGQEDWMFISWVFGRSEIFRRLGHKLVKTVRGSDRLVGRSLLEAHMPPGITESIIQCRREQAQALIEIFYTLESNYHPQQCGFTFNTKCLLRQNECDSIVYGSLLMGLMKIGLWPRKSPEHINPSISELAVLLGAFEIHKLPSSKDLGSHENCFPVNIKQELVRVLQQGFNPVLDSHIVHMQTQRGRLGMLG